MILIGLGANLNGKYGSPEDALRACAVQFANHGLNITAASHIWQSAPVPMSDQPWYKNAVCMIETQHGAKDLLNVLSEIEHKAGRVRSIQDAPRVLDLDLLSYGTIEMETQRLKLPHPRLHERAFVLYPLQEIVPDWRHPTLHKSVDDMIMNLPKGQKIKRMNDRPLLFIEGLQVSA